MPKVSDEGGGNEDPGAYNKEDQSLKPGSVYVRDSKRKPVGQATCLIRRPSSRVLLYMLPSCLGENGRGSGCAALCLRELQLLAVNESGDGNADFVQQEQRDDHDQIRHDIRRRNGDGYNAEQEVG